MIFSPFERRTENISMSIYEGGGGLDHRPVIQTGIACVIRGMYSVLQEIAVDRPRPVSPPFRRAQILVRGRGKPMHNRPGMEREHLSNGLIRAVAERRDREAFCALFDHYAPRIKTFMMGRGAGADVAEDLAQEALLIVWRKAASFDPARATASAWIFTIARNLRIDQFRRDQKAATNAHLDMVEPEGPDRPDHILGALDSDKHVRTALKQLPAEQLRIVELSFFEGKAHGEISEFLDIPLGTVKSRLRLAFGRLRDLLGDLT